MAFRALAFRMMLALLLGLSGAGATLSGAQAAFSPTPHDATAASTADAHATGHAAANTALPCVAGDCEQQGDAARHDCQGAVSHCMPAGVMAARGAPVVQGWVRASLPVLADDTPGMSQWVLDPPPPRR